MKEDSGGEGDEEGKGKTVLPDERTATANVIRETCKRGLGVSSGKKGDETWCWNESLQELEWRNRKP